MPRFPSARFMIAHCGLVCLVVVLLLAGCQSFRGVYHTVEEGQTLYRISKVYGVDENYLARVNHISDPRSLPVGKRLFIPGATRILPVPATVTQVFPEPKPPRVEEPPVARSAPTQQVQQSRSAPPVPVKPPAPTTKPPLPVSKPASTIGKGFFAWPLDGKVVRCFSENGQAPCKGVEIAAGEGTPVKAAAAGNVIYSGSGIKGYGNLIIIKHQDSFFTVYGYNSTNLVKSGSFVGKGDRIALSGTPPSGGAPRLHFEIRNGKQSVDPSFYLP